MSKFTDFLNLFMWDSIEDSEEEFNIDKALNDNWKKIDTKVKTHVTSVNEEINNFKEETNQKIENIQALPTGGTKGQVLTKQSETNGDANWEDIEANEVFVGNEEEAPETAKMIIEDEDFEESAGLSKAEVYVGAEEPTTGEKVWFRKGKNYLDISKLGTRTSYGITFTPTNTGIKITGTATDTYAYGSSIKIDLKKGKTYTLYGKNAGNTLKIELKKTGTSVMSIKTSGDKVTFTTSEDIDSITFILEGITKGTTYDYEITNIQIEPGSSAKPYEAYIEPQIFVRNSNGVYEEFANNNTKELTFTKNEVDNIFYYNIYATENEVQISADIRYNFTKGIRRKVLTIEKGYEALLSNVDGVARFPISTDSGVGVTGYVDVNTKGEVYLTTLGSATAAFINIRYRYK